MIFKAHKSRKNIRLTEVSTYIKYKLKVSLKIQAFLHAPNKKRKSACASMRSTPAGRLYSHLASKQDTTGPGQTPAQDVWRDRQGAGQLHLSTR